MPRERTRSAIKKSKRNQEQKDEARRHSLQYASKIYRRRNKEKINARARERAAGKPLSLSEEEREARSASRKEAAHRYYLKDEILSKMSQKRFEAHVEKNNGADWAWFTYNCRRGKRRVGVEEISDS
ncbi:hypothetical protein F5878DRAFT_666138 [Lentinula raphanica]|uniref:Uncharacterized protein n=1 Tax=Lentinula raphanica TaxID=153919 RepID=A0AA38NYP4_9AGAR|nr:hypothetical protein F5878DRAFT_666138 [Lentinula raphanica]